MRAPGLSVLAAALLLAGLPVPAVAAKPGKTGRPAVTRVEPPSWWPGHSLRTVRLLLGGNGLRGGRVEALGGGVTAGESRVSDSGRHLFVDLAIDPAAAPGPRRLRVTTPGGTVEAPFELLEPLPRAGRFQGFSPDDVLYLVIPDRFANGETANDDPKRTGVLDRTKGRYYHGGDLRGLTARLPYLKDLGVTAIWTTPVYDNHDGLNERERYDDQPVTDYHGYGAVDFYAVDEHLGTLADYRDLVEAAHALGLKVVQDQVCNHTGPYHPWALDPPTPTWFNGTVEEHLANEWQKWPLMDPHAAPEVRNQTVHGWFIDILPDLNQDDPEVARYLVQNALWWVGRTGVDAVRQDTLPHVPRRFWREWSAALEREYRDLTRLGELFDGSPALLSFYQGGREGWDEVDTGIDTLFDFGSFFPLRRAFAEGRALRDLATALAHDHLYPRPEILVSFLGLHDVGRFLSDEGATHEGLRLAFTFLLTSRGTPLVYYGDEIGLRGGTDPDNRRDFPGGFPGDARSAFEEAGRTAEEKALFSHVRRLLHLRRDLPALRRGGLVSLGLSEQAWVYARVHPEGTAVVFLNNAASEAVMDVSAGAVSLPEGQGLADALGAAPPVRVEGGRLRLRLPGRSGAVYVARPGGGATPGAPPR